MKKLFIIPVMALSSLCFQACNSGKGNKSGADSTSTSGSKDSTTKDTSQTASDTSKKGPATAMNISKEDAKFAMEAANGGMSEVELGSLAQQKSTNQQVKDFGAMMVRDHSKANDELVGIVKSKSITLPSTVDTPGQNLKADLSKKSGADFDKAYVNDMVKDHKEDIKKFQDATQNLKDADLKAYATKTLPVLKAHLDAAEKLQASMK